MQRFKLSFTLFLFSLLIFSCGSDTTEDIILPPDNLNVTIEYLGKGEVKLNFTATNTEYFKVNFGAPGESLQKVTGNSATYTYKEKGDYNVIVQAHASETSYVVSSNIVSMNAKNLGLDPNTGYTSATSYPGYTLAWADEFNSSTISNDWTFEIGDGCPGNCGWGNDELEYYKKENTRLEDGKLIITAKKENAGSKSYTSSRIISKGKKFFTYGRVDIRALLPKGQGIWPALWMLGENFTEVGWPKCGEIDIMEMIGGTVDGRDATVYGTVHWDNAGSPANYGGNTKLSTGIFNDEYHVFSIIWDQEKIVWLLDDKQFHVIDIRPAELNEFQKPFFFIMNVAVGGRWPGNPDGSTVFPQEMAVDYIRVFQKN